MPMFVAPLAGALLDRIAAWVAAICVGGLLDLESDDGSIP